MTLREAADRMADMLEMMDSSSYDIPAYVWQAKLDYRAACEVEGKARTVHCMDEHECQQANDGRCTGVDCCGFLPPSPSRR